MFATPTDNYLRFSARFVVPVRTARTVKADLSRAVVKRFSEEGIEVASSTSDIRVEPHSDTTDDDTPTGPSAYETSE